MDSDRPSGWELAYRRRPTSGYLERGTHEPRLEEMVPLFRSRGVSRVLDLGCGDGRNMVYLAANGFEPSGIDYAPTGIDQARTWLEREGISADLMTGRMSELPWPSSHFGAAISIMAFHHQKRAELSVAIKEVYRVLSPGGLFFADLTSCSNEREWVERKGAESVEPGTWIPTTGHEAGVPHHLFERLEVESLLREFEILSLEEQDAFWILARKPGGQ